MLGGGPVDWVTPVAFIVAIALALFVVPRAARHVAERDAALREGWAHPHVDRERKEPRRAQQQRAREGETEGDTWNT